jgi:glycosyltransferase involved in cell wall biosynthesis
VTSSEPLVSAIMPTYNGAAFVAETIESVLAQTYEPLELVVVDDASEDETAEIVSAHADRFPGRVRLQRNSERRGPCRRRNDAIELAGGELIAWIDQDDLWLPEKTARQVEALLAHPEAGLVYAGYEAFDSETGETLPWRDRASEAEGDLLVPLFVRGCFVAAPTAVFRREVLARRNLRLREADFSFGDDYYLWLALSLDWTAIRLDEVLARYRRHDANESARLAGTNFHQLRVALLRDFVREFPEARPRLGAWRRRGLAEHYLKAAEFERARGHDTAALVDVARAVAWAPRYSLGALLGRDHT